MVHVVQHFVHCAPALSFEPHYMPVGCIACCRFPDALPCHHAAPSRSGTSRGADLGAASGAPPHGDIGAQTIGSPVAHTLPNEVLVYEDEAWRGCSV